MRGILVALTMSAAACTVFESEPDVVRMPQNDAFVVDRVVVAR